MSDKLKMGFLGGIVLLAIGLAVSTPPIPQDATYHIFADAKIRWGIINAANILSNFAFIIAGITGLIIIWRLPRTTLSLMWSFFFSAVVLVGLGSAYYHWQPSNATLFWDRLPMTLCFATLTACVCAERIGTKVGQLLLIPLVLSGILSVVYWWISEKYGFGDLRPYILAQYLPITLVPLIVLLFPKSACQNRPYWLLLISYLVAKGFELNDGTIFEITNQVISGHTLKHLAAALGILMLRSHISLKANECEPKGSLRY